MTKTVPSIFLVKSLFCPVLFLSRFFTSHPGLLPTFTPWIISINRRMLQQFSPVVLIRTLTLTRRIEVGIMPAQIGGKIGNIKSGQKIRPKWLPLSSFWSNPLHARSYYFQACFQGLLAYCNFYFLGYSHCHYIMHSKTSSNIDTDIIMHI